MRFSSLHRLVVRTPGFHPGNGGSIPPGDVAASKFEAAFSLFGVVKRVTIE
jgi:hypothetical protein